MSYILGLDIGGTNIKGGIVDIKSGELVSDRIKYPTPQPASAKNFKPILKSLISDFNTYDYDKVGVGFPSRVRSKICASASNIDKAWLGMDLFKYFEEVSGMEAKVINDADAAGLAELHFGKLAEVKGTSLLLTLGTGIGSALFHDGMLLPNTEFGHLKFKGDIAERFISNKVRKEENLSYKEFGIKLNEFLMHIDFVFSPSIIILGGGISKRYQEFASFLDKKLRIDSAKLYNNAGIIGAAMAAKIKSSQ